MEVDLTPPGKKPCQYPVTSLLLLNGPSAKSVTLTAAGIEYGEPDPDYPREVKSARRVKLGQVVRQARQRFL